MVLYGGPRSRTHDGARSIWVRAIVSLAGCGVVVAGCLAASPSAALADTSVTSPGPAPNPASWGWTTTMAPLPPQAVRPKGPAGFPAVTCTSVAFCIAVGWVGTTSAERPLTATWDESRWTVGPSPDQGVSSLNAVSCVSAADCIAVGDANPDYPGKAVIETWNGAGWTQTPSPRLGSDPTDLAGVSCTGPVHCVAAGGYQVGMNSYPLIETWDGVHWRATRVPGAGQNDSASLSDISCTSSSFCVAVGDSWGMAVGDGGDNIPNYKSLIEIWNGKGWSVSPGPSPDENSLGAVSCTSPVFCMAIGSVLTTHPRVETWNGTRWSNVYNPVAASNAELDGLSCDTANFCVIVGNSTSTPTPANPGSALVEAWDGTGWSIVPSREFPEGSSVDAVSCINSSRCAGAGGETGAGEASQLFNVPMMVAGLGSSAARTGGSAAPESECKAKADVSLERTIDKTSDVPIPIPGRAVDLPAGLSGDATATFVPGSVEVCDDGLQLTLNTPDGFYNGVLSISAGRRGPFTYDSSETAWTNVPGAPPQQQFVTSFDHARVSTQVDPKLSAEFSDSGAEAEIDIGSITLKAPAQVVTLVSAGQSPLLQAGIGPELEFSVSVSRQAADTDAQDEEEQGVTQEDAVANVADQLAGDAVIAIDEEAPEFYGIVISADRDQVFFDEMQPRLAGALSLDPVLADDAGSAAATDSVSDDEATPDVAAETDAALGGDTEAVSAFVDFLLLA